MKTILWILMVTAGLVACNDNGATVTVKTDSIRRELDTLGEKIEEKAEVAGDSVKAKYKDIKERVKARMDSVRNDRNDTTD